MSAKLVLGMLLLVLLASASSIGDNKNDKQTLQENAPACTVPDCNLCPVDNAICTGCDPNFYLKDNQCVLCQIFVGNCSTCDFTSQACTECAGGYYLANDGSECKSCSVTLPNCASCSPPNPNDNPICSNCTEQYLLDNNTCTGCSQKFPTCTFCDTTNNTCNNCLPKYYRAASGQGCETCEGKDKNCQNCHATDDSAQIVVCDLCAPGYFSNASDPTSLCYYCNFTINFCKMCTGNDADVKCTACTDFLVVDKTTFKECVTCADVVTDCQGCTQDNTTFVVTCTKCGNGKVLTDGQCKDSSASTIIIVSAVVGGVVLLGAGFAIFKCMKKRRLPLAEEDYEKI